MSGLNAPHTCLGHLADIAVLSHDLIIDGLNSGEFRDCEREPPPALAQFLTEKYGGELAAVAEGCFEMVCGCDPYTFLIHIQIHGSARMC